MSEKSLSHLQILQENLCDLRKIAGWTAETLAEKMGVTKQTISNLETQKVKISRVQYIAIRAIMECEMAANSENTTLRKVMGILFDTNCSVYILHREKLRTAMTAIASIAVAGISDLQLYSSAIALLSPLGRISAATYPHSKEPSLKWLVALLESPNSIDEKPIESQTKENENESC